MSKKDVRRIEVNGKNYLWRIWHHAMFGWGGWSATLRVYSAEHKAGWLEVRYNLDDSIVVFPTQRTVVYKWTGEKGFSVHEPKTVVRVIRYARQQLAWKPSKNDAPLIIENGYQLLNDLGYELLDAQVDE